MQLAGLGQGLLWGTVLACAAALALGAVGAVTGRPAWRRWGRRLVLAAFLFASGASLALLVALVGDDFSIRYVAERSSRATPLAYKIGAWWGGQEGSLLFWTWLLLAQAALVATARPPREAAPLWPAALACLMAVALFYAGMTAFLESPFQRLDQPPADGAGLNPLLQSPSMLAHPVALYLGYVGVTVPFAFMVAGLLVGTEPAQWLAAGRRWALAAWWFLGAGILLGGEWAYKELGWGGFWAWDPVENASLVPWLLLTAWVHSTLPGSRPAGMARWHAALLAAAFVAVQLGTFVTRSGVLVSVHAFAQSPSGPYFMTFVGVAAAFSLWLVGGRWSQLGAWAQAGRGPEREGLLVAGNLVLAVTAFTVAFGSAVPVLSRLLGQEVSVQAPYFERVTAPLFAVLLALMGLAVGWPPRGGLRAWWRARWPELAASGLFAAVLWAYGGVHRPALVAGLACAFLAGAAPVAQMVRRWPGGGQGRSARFWAATGGLWAHLGVALVAVSATAGVAFQVRETRSLAVGESAELAAYVLRFDGMALRDLPEAMEVYAVVSLYRGDTFLGTLEPARRFYRGQPPSAGITSEVAIHRDLAGDVYVALAEWEQRDGAVAGFELYFNPLTGWLWAGGALTLLGTLVATALHPAWAAARRRERARVLEEIRAAGPPAPPPPSSPAPGLAALPPAPRG